MNQNLKSIISDSLKLFIIYKLLSNYKCNDQIDHYLFDYFFSQLFIALNYF